ncbi:metal-dependent hydrolase [Oceanobacillus oncorhynchi]|uniref:metal-dependent hydrolase n=1 Tax=Oceanobacillus oncorhynchi TaxID=545501 RepID=UPI001D029579|nr:metal-dependent hydrolase [Oceanobacillus oncorhynchi]
MEWPTHMLSGIVAGYVITDGDWRGAVVGGIAAIVPDFDEYRSRFGKMVFPISYLINKTVGHRTITHSLLFLIIVGSVLFIFFDTWVVLSVEAGILAHIVGDMLTGKVQFFYPVNKKIGVRVGYITYKLIDRIARVILFVFGMKELIVHFR